MAKKTKVLRYTEEQFVSLLENIVKRVKNDEKLTEARKLSKSRPSNRK